MRPKIHVSEVDDKNVVLVDDFSNSQPKTPPTTQLKEVLIKEFSEMTVVSQSWLAQLTARSCRFLVPLSEEIEDFNVRAVQVLSTLPNYSAVEIEEITTNCWSEYSKLLEVMKTTVMEKKEAEDEEIGEVEESQGGEDPI